MGIGVHNLTEDVIKTTLDELLNEKEGICKCDQCKLDMICYSLNKTKPMYVVSSRGIIHSQNRRREDIQTEIDIYSIVKEAIEAVSHTPRHGKEMENIHLHHNPYQDYKYMFVFPIIIGRVLDGNSLEVITEANIFMRNEASSELIGMTNNRWSNPARLVKQTDGSFTFWPVPISTDKAGIQKTFQLNLEIKKEGYETMYKFFEITTISLENNKEELDSFTCNFYNIQDLYIFKEE